MEKNKENSFFKKTIIYFLGTFSTKVVGTIIIPIYALYLTANELGEFDFQQTIGNLLSPIIVLAIWESILRFGIGSTKKEISKIITNSLFFTFFSVILYFFILCLLYSYIYDTSFLSLFYILMIIFLPLVTVLQYIARALGKNFIFIFSGMLSSLLNLFLMILLIVVFKLGLFGLAISFVISQFINIVYLFFALNICSYFSFKLIDFYYLRKLLIYSSPLVFNLTFGWFMNGFSRVFINISLGTTQNGIFAFGTKFSGIMASFASVINMAAIEDAVLKSKSKNFVKLFEKDVNRIIEVLWLFLILSVPIICFCFNFISSIDYSESLNLIPLLLLTAIVQGFSTLVGNFFNILKQNKYIFLTSIYGAVVTVAFSFIFLNILGLFGVALAQTLGSCIVFFSRYIKGRKIENYSLYWRPFVFYFILFLIVSYCCVVIRKLFLTVIIFIMILFYSIFKFKEVIITLIKKVRK